MENKRTTKRRNQGRYIFLFVGLAITCMLYVLSNSKVEATEEIEVETVEISPATICEEDVKSSEWTSSFTATEIKRDLIDYSYEEISYEYEKPEMVKVFEDVEEKSSNDSSEKIILSDEELFTFQQIVFAEAGTCSPKAQRGVASSILNRVRSSRYPNTITEVVFAKNQYAPTEGDKIFFWDWPDNTQGYYREVMPEDITDEVKQSVEAALNGDNPIRDFTGFYGDLWISEEERAYREQFEDVIVIDGLVFHGDWT